ncbi:MAG: photosynthetic reaction center subunit H [Proteobacteria bacterium]|nr:photosynthetic reaction center subunit H [Pseudomonadota bacterium]
MPAGAITGYIDVAQLTLYAFWLFFAGLIFYLRREDKREGYPLDSDRGGGVVVQGFPAMPSPKTFLLADGSSVMAPRVEAPQGPIAAVPVGPWPGAPLQPTGNPMTDGVGPAAYANRADHAELTSSEGVPMIVPLRADPRYFLAAEDPDPRGFAVIGADKAVAGTVTDLWIDRSEVVVRYVEIALANQARTVLVPMTLVRVLGDRRQLSVKSVTAAQFADAPAIKNPESITLLEEDRISAYFASGHMYATPARLGPVL